MDECAFCRIVAGTAPADVIAETPRVIAFCDIAPITPGHLLVVPRAHGAGLAQLADEDAAAMTLLARRLAIALRASGLRGGRRGVESTGTTLFLADGADAGQDVFHAHLHVIPRYPGDGTSLRTGRRRATPHGRATVAARIRAALAG